MSSDVAMTCNWHGAFPLQSVPVFAVIVVGLNEIFCSVPDCWAVTVAVIVKGPYAKVGMGTVVVVPVASDDVWPDDVTMICRSAEMLQSGVQNWITSAWAEIGAINAAAISDKTILELCMFLLRGLGLIG